MVKVVKHDKCVTTFAIHVCIIIVGATHYATTKSYVQRPNFFALLRTIPCSDGILNTDRMWPDCMKVA